MEIGFHETAIGQPAALERAIKENRGGQVAGVEDEVDQLAPHQLDPREVQSLDDDIAHQRINQRQFFAARRSHAPLDTARPNGVQLDTRHELYRDDDPQDGAWCAES